MRWRYWRARRASRERGACVETERARTNAPPRHIRHFRFCLRFLSKRHETTEGAGNLSPTCVSVPFGGIQLARPLLTPYFREFPVAVVGVV